MADQKIGVSLEFKADTRKARQELDNLNKALDKVMQTTSRNAVGNRFTEELRESSIAAAQLKSHLQEAFNANTGKLDLTKFNQALRQSGMSITQYKNALIQAGPAGQQAFNQLAMSITTAEIPLIRMSSRLQKLGTTLANTARWQISSSILQGFTGALSNAYRFAEDLNASLNDIRIVTGYNIDQMDTFAKKANAAAKALSTTTKKYTDASLIYFQQGELTDAQVQDRTNLTIKMANVTGQSVKEVSDQLTAVWNNFDDGSKSLEHYVDVMVALGAETASSSEEISEGLNKFAATAETVGLSYEYAATALATVTATTRESADVVGTAFKTLFARIQDLELGKTLDDGTTLGQYSQALAAVGINVKNANGEVKKMDDILNEMGAKWDSLNKSQQIALAQNVAGVRQYTQLVALMDNWDTFQKNLSTAMTSEGALQEQADIYAESWQAARDRVTASLEAIYQKLLDDKFFIKLLDFISNAVDGVSSLIDSLGGLEGVLTTIGTILLNVFSQQLSQGLVSLQHSLMGMTEKGRTQLRELQKETTEAMVENYGTKGASGLQGRAVASMAESQNAYADAADRMNEKQKQIAQSILEQQKGLAQAAEEEAKVADEAERSWRAAEARMKLKNHEAYETNKSDYAKMRKDIFSSTTSASLLGDVGASQYHYETLIDVDNLNTNSQSALKEITEIQTRLQGLGITSKDVSGELANMLTDRMTSLWQNYAQAADEAQAVLADSNSTLEQRKEKITALIYAESQIETWMSRESEQADQLSKELKELGLDVDQVTAVMKLYAQSMAEGSMKTADAVALAQKMPATMQQISKKYRTLSDDIVALAQGFGAFHMVLNNIQGVFDTINNTELTFWEKLLSITGSLAMTIPTLISALNALKSIEVLNTVGKLANAAATWEQVRAENALQKESGETVRAKIQQTATEAVDTAKKKVQSGWSGLKNAWNQNALASSSRFELQAEGAHKGQYKILSGDGAGAYASADIAGSMAGKTALKNLGTKALSGLTTAAAVTAAIAAAKGIYDAADEAYNRDERAAERAEEAAKNLADAYEEASTKYSELNQTVDNYNDQMEKLGELSQGTLEYSDALFEANEAAMKLIDTYPELAGEYEVLANGLVVLNAEILENIQLTERQKKLAAQEAATLARQEARDARLVSDKTQFARNELKGSTWELTEEDKAITGKGAGIGAGIAGAGGALAGGSLIGAKLGSAVGSFAGPLGTVIGAAAGVVLGAVVGSIFGGIAAAIDQDEATSQEKKAIDDLAEAYKQMGEAAFEDAQMEKIITDPKLLASLKENKDELRELVKATIENTNARLAENEILAREQLNAKDSNFKNYNATTQKAIAAAVAARKTNKQDEIEYTKRDFRKGWLWGLTHTSTDEGEDTFYKWAAANGIDPSSVDFGGKTVHYKAYDKEQEKTVKKEVSYEQLAAWQEAQDLQADFDATYKQITDLIMNVSREDTAGGIASVLGTGDLSNLSVSQMRSFVQAYNDGAYDGQLQELGNLMGEDLFAKVNEAINNWDYKTALKTYTDRVQSEIDATLQEGAANTEYSEQALANYAEVLMETSEALKHYDDEWERMDKKKLAAKMAVANAKFAQGVYDLNKAFNENAEALNNFNEGSLETWEAVAQLQGALEKVFGVKVSAKYVTKNLTKIQELAQGNVESLEQLRQEAARDYIMSLDISEESRKDFTGLLDELIANTQKGLNDKTLEVGANINDSKYIAKLNKMLEAGEITAEEVQNAFGAIGYAVDIGTTTKTQKVITKFSGNIDGKTFEGQYEQETTMDIPYIKGSDTQSAGSDIIDSKTGLKTGVKGGTENGSGFTYTGAPKGGKDLLAGLQKETKERKKEIDRNHLLKESLSEIERELNLIAKAKDRAFGADKLALIDREIAKQQELLKTQQDYVKALEKDYRTDAKELYKYGFKTDAEGNITNYEKIMGVYAGRGDEAFENASKAVSQYESTLNDLEQAQEKVLENQWALEDLALEKLEYQIELKIKISDNELKRLERQLEKLDDPLQDAAEAIATLGDIMDENFNQMDIYTQGIKDVLAQSFSQEALNEIFGNNGEIDWEAILTSNKLSEAQVNKLEEYRDKLIELEPTMDEFYEKTKEKVLEALEATHEEFEKNNTQLERYNKLLSTYQNIIELVGKKTLGVSNEMLDELSRAQIANAQGALANAEAQRKVAEAQLKALREQRKEFADDSEEAKHLDELIEAAEGKLIELEGVVQDKLLDSLSLFAAEFEKTIKRTTDTFEESMTGIYGTYERMQEAFNQQSEINDRFVSGYQKVYELSKLNRDINKSLDDTDSIRSKKVLLELQEEINALQKSDAKLSQHDLDYLRKKYELKLAEIALEDSQNAKSQVRMRRDNEGNWSYVYTVDEDKTAEKQQTFEDKLFEIQTLEQNYIDEMQQRVIQAEIDMIQAINSLRVSDFETQEDYQAEVTRITEYYTGLRNYALNELNTAIENSSDIYQNDWLSYDEYSGYKLDRDSGWRTQFSETFIAQKDGMASVEQAQQVHEEAVTAMTEKLGLAFNAYQADIEAAFDQVGISLNDTSPNSFKNAMAAAVKLTNEETAKIIGALNTMGTTATTKFGEVLSAAKNNYTAYKQKIEEYKAQTQGLIDKINLLIKKKAEIANDKTVDETKPTENPKVVQPGGNGVVKKPVVSDVPFEEKEGTGDDGTTFTGNNQGPKTLSWDQSTIFYREDDYPKNSAPIIESDSVRLKYSEVAPFGSSVYMNKMATYGGIVYKLYLVTTKDNHTIHLWGPYQQSAGKGGTVGTPTTSTGSTSNVISRFDTGGYTGEWDSSGRLAMLHQKELVLNADDTSKFLSAVEIVRNIAQVIDLRAAAQQSALAAMSTVQVAPTTQTLQQDVTIHAEFPNATSHSEIEEAFDTLLNRAAQFANRKN